MVCCGCAAWWRHQMEAFSALLAICAGNSQVTDEFPSQRPATQGFDVFFDLRLNKRLSKQSRRWWFQTPSCSLWRHCNVLFGWLCMISFVVIFYSVNDKTDIIEILKNQELVKVMLWYRNSLNLIGPMVTSWNGNIFRATGPLWG